MTHTLPSIIDLTNAPTPPRWFEFLLEPGRLQQHLETTGCDPSPIQLIRLFFRNSPNLDSTGTTKFISQGGVPSAVPIANGSPNFTNGQVAPSGEKSAPGSGSGVDFLSSSGCNGATDGEINEAAASDGGGCNSKANNNDGTERLYQELGDYQDIVIPPNSYEAKYRLRKAYALQTLSVKVASFLKWDLDTICDGLTIPIQYKLMQALTSACLNEACPPEVNKFARVVHCHWFLRSAMTYRLSTLQTQANSTTIIYLSQLQQQQQTADNLALMSMGELFSNSSKQLENCLSELKAYIWELKKSNQDTQSSKKFKNAEHPFKKAKLSRPKMECFDSRDENFNDWKQCETIDPYELFEAACYDLGRFYFFEECYPLAKETFEIISESTGRFPLLNQYLESARDILTTEDKPAEDEDEPNLENCDTVSNQIYMKRKQTEKYLFDCMTHLSQSQEGVKSSELDEIDIEMDGIEEDCDLRFEQQALACHHRLPENSAWYLQVPTDPQQQYLLELGKGDKFMSMGEFKQAMGCFVGALMLITDFFRIFSKNYVDEEPYITRMIQCSISLSCYTQAVALCQMTKNLNYTIAFKQLNERMCNDCCDDIYECLWNVTLLEYIINLHARRGEVERRTKVIQLIGQLELNENNPEEILREAEHVRRGRFFRIMANKYL